MSSDSFLRKAAVDYAKREFYVFPLWPRSKRPMSGLKYSKPSRDIDIIEYWWNFCPDANIALPTGNQYNNLIVIDLDVSNIHNGVLNLKEILTANNLVLPNSLTIESGSHGIHLYFRNVKGKLVYSKQNVFDGIDILSAGAHVVSPPSVHENGNAYKIMADSVLNIADATDSVYRFLELCNVCSL